MKRRLLAAGLCVVLAASMIAGCGGGSDGKEPDASKVEQGDSEDAGDTADEGSGEKEEGKAATFPLEEPVTMSMGLYQVVETDVTKTLTLTEMEKRTNIHWDYSPYGQDIGEKVPLEFGGGEYKDVYMRAGISEMDIAKYAQEEIVIPLNDLIDQYMPNLKALLDERNLWGYITSPDGNIYSLPQIDDSGVGMLMFVNQEWMEKLNIEEPTNAEEFLDMLRKFKTEDPNGNGEADEVPLILCNYMQTFLPQYFGITTDALTGSTVTFEDGQVGFYAAGDKYKSYLKLLRTMVEEGLVNADYESIGWEEQGARTLDSDNIGAFFHWTGYFGVGSENDENYPALKPLAESGMLKTSGVGLGGLVITDKCEYPELVCQWADYFYTEEGARLFEMGLDGVSYELSEDGKTFEWILGTELGEAAIDVQGNATLIGNYNSCHKFAELLATGNTDPDQVFLNEQRRIALESAKTLPAPKWTDSELTERAQYIADLVPYVDQYRAAVTSGKTDLDSSWDEYIDTLNQMGLERLLEIDQAAYERYLQLVK